MLADQVDVVLGLDTHRDRHALAVREAGSGALARGGGVLRRGRGPRRGASGRRPPSGPARLGRGGHRGLRRRPRPLPRRSGRAGDRDRPPGAARGAHRAKSEALDAARAARTALARGRQACPRAGGIREALRMLPVTRAGAVEVRRRALQQLPALIVSAPEEIRRTLRGRSGRSLITRCRTLRAPRGADLALIATVAGPRGLARRVVVGQRRGQGARARHRRARAGPLPPAMAELGVGPISAAQLLVSSSHAGRFPGEAAFAAQLAGVAPVPAPSGRVMRHRLNRGGDRRLNQALRTVILVRRQRDERTRADIERRIAEGKCAREAVRCLKRSLARHLYRMLEAARLPA
jgi:transposase